MSTRWVLNSAVIAAGAYGHYTYGPVTPSEAAAWLREPGWVSRVGYPETVAFLRRISGVEIPLSRETSAMAVGDVALVARLRYRIQEPATKGTERPDDGAWELGWLRRDR